MDLYEVANKATWLTMDGARGAGLKTLLETG
jgi:hypothetical protein